MKLFPAYILFIAIPYWHVFLGHFSVYELALVFSYICLPLNMKPVKLNALDYLIIAYVVLQVISVLASGERIYEGARNFRYHVFTPVLTYLYLRLARFNYQQVTKLLLIAAISLSIEAALLISFYLSHGLRPLHNTWFMNMVSMGFWCSLMIAFLISVFNFFTKRSKLIVLLVLPILCGALYISANRTSLISLLIIFPFVLHFSKTRKGKNLIRLIPKAYMAVLLLAIVFVPVFDAVYDAKAVDKEVVSGTSRIYNYQLYVNDLIERLRFWNTIGGRALSNPVVGHGAASYTVGETEGVGFRLGSSHNALISQIVVVGIPGFVLFCLMYFSSLKRMAFVKSLNMGPHGVGLYRFVLFGLISICFVMTTNDLTAGRATILFLFMGLSQLLSKPMAKIAASKMQRYC